MSIIRQDEKGLYVIVDGNIARPGPVSGYSHAYKMDDGGLAKGDKVKARHPRGTPLTIITLCDGSERAWYRTG